MTKSKSVILLGVMLPFMAACADKYAVAWRTTAATRVAAEATDKAIAMASEKRRTECKEAAKNQEEYKGCVLNSKEYEAIVVWRNYAAPAINSALILTINMLVLAEKSKNDVDWITFVAPAVCMLAAVTEKWAHLFSEKHRASVAAILKMAKGVTCE